MILLYRSLVYILDTLNVDPLVNENMTYEKTEFLSTFEQRFMSGQSEYEMLRDEKQWSQFVPHENSGPCYTYDPPFESDPGYEISIYMRMNSTDWEPNLQIFLHQKNKFFYSTKPNYNIIYLDPETLRKTEDSHPRAIGKAIF